MNSLLLAICFMTLLPVCGLIKVEPSNEHYQRAIYYYPLVGVILASILVLLNTFSLATFSPFLSSCVLISVWVALTGALHIDGLADSWDAYFAHHGSADRTLEVMKDPRNGTMAVIAIVLCLMLKVAALTELLMLDISIGPLVFGVLVLPRTMVLLLMLLTSYVSRQPALAMGGELNSAQSPFLTYVLLIVSTVLLCLLMGVAITALSVLGGVILLIWWRAVWVRMIGGFTGDVLGAYIEMSECLLLLIMCFWYLR